MILSISDIPEDKSVIIYGYGHSGEMLLRLLKLYRPNQEIKCIVDDNLSLNIEGIKTVDFNGLINIYEDGDLVLVSVLIHEKIVEKLRNYSNIEYSLVKLNYFHDENEFNNFEIFLNSSNGYIPQLYPLNMYPNSEKFNKVLSLFSSLEDKILYSTIVKTWHDNGDLVKEYFVNNFQSIGRHYFEYMNFSDMNVVIEGGVADGTNSIEFLSSLPSESKIYGFDPLFEDYCNLSHKNYLLNHNNFEIITKGLWDKKDLLSIDISGLLPLARVFEKNTLDLNKSKEIKVLSLDDFIREKKIAKIDFIKLDIDGAEINCLKGAINTLKRDRPQLSISIYHRYEDLYEIPLFLNEVLDNYTYRLGHYHYELGETVLYAFPNKN